MWDRLVAFIVSGLALTLISFAASIIKNKQMIGLGDIPVMASMIVVLGGHYGIAAIFITFIVAAPRFHVRQSVKCLGILD